MLSAQCWTALLLNEPCSEPGCYVTVASMLLLSRGRAQQHNPNLRYLVATACCCYVIPLPPVQLLSLMYLLLTLPCYCC
jgi:hypothetical protein